MPATTNVILLGMPAMLRELIHEVLDAVPGTVVVAELPNVDLQAAQVGAPTTDVVIVEAEAASEERLQALVRARGRFKVLGVSSDGRRAILHELRPARVPLNEVSPRSLIEVLGGESVRLGEDGRRWPDTLPSP